MKVAEILMATGATFVTEEVYTCHFSFGGIKHDRHFGLHRASCSRTPWHPRGSEIFNTRQISIVALEDCALVAARLEIDKIKPSWLGANLAVSYAPGLNAIEPATRLVFPSGATLYVTEENVPCRQPGQIISDFYGRPGVAAEFVKQAMGLRGGVALVERAGATSLKDNTRIGRPPNTTRAVAQHCTTPPQ